MDQKRRLKIAILGTRGIPASYGGFETFAEELGKRLTDQGHAVTVYGRRFWKDGKPTNELINNINVRRIFSIRHKYLETPIHALLSCLDWRLGQFDLVLLCNAANSPFAWLPRVRGIPVVINVDGIERRRAKWNLLGRLWYRLGEMTSVWFASRIVADANVIADYYQEHFGCPSEVIAYGAEANRPVSVAMLSKLGLERGRYILYVSRLEPENNALGVVQAYSRLKTDIPLVVVGDAPYAKGYIERVKAAANGQVIFTGYQFGECYRVLQANCLLYIQASEVGGTHPALVAAMAYGSCVVANDVPEHREVLGDAGVYYSFNDFEDLGSILGKLLADPTTIRGFGEIAAERAKVKYSWKSVTDSYESLFYDVLGV